MLDQGQPEAQKGAKHQGREVRPALQASWLAHPDESAHEQAQVDAGDMDQEALEDVVVVPQVSPAHPTSFECVGKGPFEQLSASSQKLLAALSSDTPTVGVDSLALRFLVLPAPLSAVGFRDVASNLAPLQPDQNAVAVVALVQHRLLHALGDSFCRLVVCSLADLAQVVVRLFDRAHSTHSSSLVEATLTGADRARRAGSP